MEKKEVSKPNVVGWGGRGGRDGGQRGVDRRQGEGEVRGIGCKGAIDLQGRGEG